MIVTKKTQERGERGEGGGKGERATDHEERKEERGEEREKREEREEKGANVFYNCICSYHGDDGRIFTDSTKGRGQGTFFFSSFLF